MGIIRINDLPEGSGSLSGDDIFLFMDDPSGGGVTKKISLSQISDAIGGGGGGNPFDQNLNSTDFPTFSGISLSNGTTVTQGTYDNGTGGNNGISLNCYVGYELNWQGGRLKSTYDNGQYTHPLYLDSPLAASSGSFTDLTVDNTEVSLINASIFELGTISGSNEISFGADRLFQTITLNGNAVTLTKGSGWPESSGISADTVLKIVATSGTSIVWSVVTDWFNQPPAGALSSGTHLFLLRAMGSSVIEGHYIGNKTN